MKNLMLLALAVFVLQSCTKDFGNVEVTYTKATAIYGDLAELRQTPLYEPAATIENPGKVFVAQDMLLIGEEGKGIHIVDNTNPESPVNLSFLNIPGNREYYIEGDYLYAESHYDMLKINISDKSNPYIETRIENAFASEFKDDQGRTLIGFDFERVTEKVSADNDIARQTWGTRDVYYYDYANKIIPPSQVPTSFAGNSGSGVGSVNRVAYANGYVYVISRSVLSTFDDNSTFELVNTTESWRNMETVYPQGDRLYIGTQSSVEVFDISSPNNPLYLSSFDHATSCDPVLPNGDVAYVTLRTGDVGNCPGDENALLVLDITDTNRLVALQEIGMESPFGMTLSGNRLFVGEGSNGLKIFDASNPRNLRLETHDQTVEAYDIIHHPSNPNLVLIAGPEGISQYGIENNTGLDWLSTISF